MEEYGPEDAQHVRQIVPRVNPSAMVGNVQQAEDFLAGFLDTFKRMLAGDQVAAIKFQRAALTCLHEIPGLQQTTQLSFLLALMQCAELGLIPGRVAGHAYVIPYGREATLIPGYQGYVHCAYRSGQVASIQASPVYSSDEFRYARGTKPFVHHVPSGEDGALTHAYCCVWLKGAPDMPNFWVVDEKQARRAQAFSQTGRKGSGPWVDHPEAMWMKTALRRLRAWIPMSYEMRRLLEIDQRDEHKEDVKQHALSGKGFLEPTPEAPKALPEQASEPVAPPSRATRQKAPARPQAPPAPPSSPEAEWVETPDGPQPAEKPKPGEEMKLAGQVLDLVAALTEKGVKVTGLGNVEAMPVEELRTWVRKLEARLAAVE